MSYIFDGRFIAGLIVGILGYYAWQRYQSNKSQG